MRNAGRLRLSRSALTACAAFPLFLPAAALPSAAAEVPKVKSLPIVEKSIAFHGGEVYRRSRSSLQVCSRSGCFAVRAVIDGGLFEYEVESQAGEGTRKVRWTNSETREWRGGQPVELDEQGAQRARDFVSARVYFPYLPFRLGDDSVFFQDLGLERWGEEELQRVKVTFTPGSSTDADDEYLYWFEPATGRLVQLAYSFDAAEGIGLRFRRLFNQRRVEGILFADQTNLGAAGPQLSVDRITPDFVAREMQEVSTVSFREIAVEALP